MTFSKGVLAPLAIAFSLLSSSSVQALPLADASPNVTTTQVPSTTISKAPGTTGTFITSLEREGRVTSLPFVTQTITEPTPSLKTPLPTFPTTIASNGTATPTFAPLAEDAIDPFQPFATGPYPSQVTARGDHPIPRLNVVEQSSPYHTNKFYANFYLGSQGSGTFTHPYTLTWAKGTGNAKSWGMVVTQLDDSAKSFGDPNPNLPGSPSSFYINPLGIQHMIFSAAEFGESTTLSTSDLDTFSANAILSPGSSSGSSQLVIPVVQGMAFATGEYTNLTPNIESGVFFSNLTSVGSPGAGLFKYEVQLADGSSWLLYAAPSDGTDPKLTLSSSSSITGPSGWNGFIQIAKNPLGSDGESLYDAAAGVYPTAGSISASVSGTTGSYTLSWAKSGLDTSKTLLMFALPHHLESFDGTTTGSVSSLKLATTTKGTATAVSADSWTLTESNLPVAIGWEPFDAATGSATTQYSSAALAAIAAVASAEVAEDMGAQTNLNSMYYSGKGLSKFASIVWAIHDVLGDTNLAAQGLAQLKTAFALFATNQQQFPLVYDTVWGGAVSSASYINGDLGADFGNTGYNDHHFHYGYFLHAASIIAYLDPTWLTANADWVDMLARDANNPSSADNIFPVFRMFDWYHGHSWAAGLFEAGDSKNEESSSEDVMFAYGLKMWGRATSNAAMEAQGNLMLSVLSRSLNTYFLYSSDNDVEPSNFIGNKVSGIMFENKIDHTTYFGGNLEFVQAIHMIPLEPSSSFIRQKSFVQQEWEAFFADGAADPASNVDGGWKGILYANLALYDPVSSFNFFNQPNFNSTWLDGGASLTWYLTFAAGLGGA